MTLRLELPALALALVGALACEGGLDTGRGRDAGGIRLMDSGPVAGDAGRPGPDAGGADGGGDPDGGRPDGGRPTGPGEPPFGASSGGRGGGPANGDLRMTPDGVQYRLLVPSSYREGTPTPAMVVFSGTEGGAVMTMNLVSLRGMVGLGDVIFAVLDGPTYFGVGAAGASALDDVRARYDVDNDRTYLLSESAGTRAGLQLGLRLRQSFFAAYWANDVNASDTPGATAADLGFAPWGNAGPGGDFADANAIVAGMRGAGYRIAEPAPYDGPGAGTHGDPNQFIAALRWFPGRSRR